MLTGNQRSNEALTHAGGFPERGSHSNERADFRPARSRQGFFIPERLPVGKSAARGGADNDRRLAWQSPYREAGGGWRDKPSTTQGLGRSWREPHHPGKAGQPIKATDGSGPGSEGVGIGTPPAPSGSGGKPSAEPDRTRAEPDRPRGALSSDAAETKKFARRQISVLDVYRVRAVLVGAAEHVSALQPVQPEREVAMTKNCNKVARSKWKAWSELSRYTFNDVYDRMTQSPKLFLHPKADQKVNEQHWNTTAWNAAWIAADAVRDGSAA